MPQYIVHAEVTDMSEYDVFWNVVSVMSGSSIEEIQNEVRSQLRYDFSDHPSGNRFECSFSVREVPSVSLRLDGMFMDLREHDERFVID
jgi:hypothetical protein